MLAAGTGSRLAPLTDSTAKCLVRLNGVSILERLIRTLSNYDFNRLVVVVGHESDSIQDYLGDHVGDIQISYVVSTCYRTTNNIYSLWLARHVIDEPFLLIESDLVFDESLLEGMMKADRIAVSRQLRWMNGTTVTLDGEAGVSAFCLGEMSRPDATHYKTVNMYSFARSTWRAICARLDDYIVSRRTGDYYESVLAEMVADGSLSLAPVLFDAGRWYEIDTHADLTAAELIFPRCSATMRSAAALPIAEVAKVTDASREQMRSAREAEYELLQSEHGGYWRHSFVDHAYLYNLHFPPESLFERFSGQIHELVLNYPVAQNVVAGLVGTLIGQPAERIVVGNGAAELIKIVSGHLAAKLIIPVPSFNEYANAAPAGNVVEFALDAPSFQLDVDRFAAEAISCGADFAVVVTPNNPTSLLVPRADLLRLLGLLDGHGCTLIVDESFIDFADAGAAESLKRDVANHPNLAIMKSMSKAYGICGIRIGYLLTANAGLDGQMRDNLHIWNLNGFAEEFLRVAPGYRQDFAESCDAVRAERSAFYAGLCAVPGLTVWEPDANFIFCRLPDDGPSGPEVTRRLFVEDNIYIKHCAEKTMPDPSRYVRIASRTHAENRAVTAALARILAREFAR